MLILKWYKIWWNKCFFITKQLHFYMCIFNSNQLVNVFFNTRFLHWTLSAYIISEWSRVCFPVSVVLDVPPLDLQRVWGRSCPTEGTSHLYVLSALRSDVMRHLGKKSCNTRMNGVKILKRGCVSLQWHTSTAHDVEEGNNCTQSVNESILLLHNKEKQVW